MLCFFGVVQVATLQPHAIVKLSEDTSRSTVEAICEAITLHGPPFRPYGKCSLIHDVEE